MYGNEKEVGEAIRRSGLDRDEVYVTSKLSNDAHRPDDARQAFDESLKALGLDYLDLFLIHWPLPTRYDGDFVSTWSALTEFYREGRARSIGASNFQPHHLRRLHAESEVIPAVNQIEVNPYLTQDDVRGFCAEHQIAIEAWSPLGRGNVLDDPEIAAIAQRYGPDQCGSPADCFAQTRDAQETVRLMASSLRRPDLLDRAWTAPWLGSENATELRF